MKHLSFFLMFTLMVPALLADDPVIPADGPWVVRAYYSDANSGEYYASILGAWEMDRVSKFILVEVDEARIIELSKAGFAIELDEKKTAEYHRNMQKPSSQRAGIPGYPCYRTVEETFTTALSLASTYPDLAEWIDIGDSWRKTQGDGGYDMMVLKITNQSITETKPVLFVMTSVHAREYTPAELNTRFAEYLLNNYGTDADATWLVDHREIHLVLQANPDGRKKAESGLSWRKNTNDNECSSGTSYGVDLNRNFPFQWGCCGGSSGDSCDITYRGISSLSEPESDAIVTYCRSIIDDQRGPDMDDAAPENAHDLFLDIHSYSELVLWSWGFENVPNPNNDSTRALGRKLAYFNGYNPKQATGLYVTDGTTIDFAYGEFGIASYTVELGTDFFQDCQTFETKILPDNLKLLIYAAKACEAPYQLGRGPDSEIVNFFQNGADEASVEVSSSDQHINQSNGTEPVQNIAAAHVAIDEFPSQSASPVSLSPSDGTWDSPEENSEGTIDFTGLSQEKHTLYVQSQDASGYWGVVSASDFQVPSPGTSIQGHVREMGSMEPVSCIVRSGGFQTRTNPADGFYQLYVTQGSGNLEVISTDHGGDIQPYTIADNQNLTQNFELTPYCDALTQDAESGLGDWTAESTWAISSESAHNGSSSLVDSPGGTYASNLDIELTSPAFSMATRSGTTLAFWHRYDYEPSYDYGYVEYQLGSGEWVTIDSFNGTSTGFDQDQWVHFEKSIPALDEQDDIHIRFRVHTDSSVVRDGWSIDDIQVRGAGLECVTTMTMAAYLGNWPSPYHVTDIVLFINNQEP